MSLFSAPESPFLPSGLPRSVPGLGTTSYPPTPTFSSRRFGESFLGCLNNQENAVIDGKLTLNFFVGV